MRVSVDSATSRDSERTDRRTMKTQGFASEFRLSYACKFRLEFRFKVSPCGLPRQPALPTARSQPRRQQTPPAETPPDVTPPSDTPRWGWVGRDGGARREFRLGSARFFGEAHATHLAVRTKISP